MKRLRCKHRTLFTLVVFWWYQRAAICAAFVFSGKVTQERQPGNLLRPTHDLKVDFDNRHKIFEVTDTALHGMSLKFKNFDMMLDAFRDEPVLVYFSSNVCGSCNLQKKELVNIQNHFFASMTTTKKKILMIDADHFPQICLRYDVAKLPCILFINNGSVLLRLDGFTTAEDIMNHIQKTSNLKGFCP